MTLAIGQYRHRVALANPGEAVPDGDGGFTQGWIPLTPPTWDCAIEAASARDLERVTGGTVLTSATHLIRGRYHSGITTATRITFRGREFEVQSVQNVDERSIALILICAEIVRPAAAPGAVSPLASESPGAGSAAASSPVSDWV